MASLAPPNTTNRNRASSTNIRPALTLNTLGRRRSNSDLPPPAASPVLDISHSLPVPSPILSMHTVDLSPLDIPPATPAKSLARASFVEFYARVMDMLRVAHKEAALVSTPSSPRLSLSRTSTSTDETLLPIASPSVATFSEAYAEKPTRTKSSSASWWHGSPSVHTPVFFVIALFPLSTALLLFCMATLPITQAWPRNITDLAQLGRELHGYSQSGSLPMLHVIGVLAVVVAWNHAWSIPGSVLWNVLAGALFSPVFATVLLTALTTVGSVCASLLAAPLAPFLVRIFPRALDMTRSAIEGSSSSSPSNPDSNDSTEKPPSSSSTSSPWVRLSVLRLIGIVPWSALNIACGVCGVALRDCVLGSFIGSLPWTAVTCQIGDILQTVAAGPGARAETVQGLLTSPEVLGKLVVLSVVSVVPILGRERVRRWVQRGGEESRGEGDVQMSEQMGVEEREERGEIDNIGRREGTPTPTPTRVREDREQEKERAGAAEEERTGRWAWVREWRERIRVPSRSRVSVREAWRRELEVLTDEKNQSLPM